MNLSDADLIRNTLARLARAGDLGAPDEAADSYCTDGVFAVSGFPADFAPDGRMQGREELRATYAGLFAANAGNVRHWVGDSYFEHIDDDEALVHSYFALVRVGMAPVPGIVLTGTYADHFRREDGIWRIAHRDCVIDPRPEHRGTAPTDALIIALDTWREAR